MIKNPAKKISTKIFSAVMLSAVYGQKVLAAPIDDAKNGADSVDTGGTSDIGSIVKDVTNILLFIVGAISVIMLIVGGIRYVMSAGDPNATKGAKDTIMYALIGIVVAFAAYGIVNWVINALV